MEDLEDLILQQYDNSSVGGNLHIVLDDYNVKDHYIVWCRDVAIPENYHNTDQDLELKIANLLLVVPENKRKALIKSALRR